MGKNMLFPKLLITSIVALASIQGAFAANSADQTVTGTLGTLRQIVTNGGNIAATIDENTGALSVDLTPGFRITTNSSGSQNLTLTSLCNTSGGTQNAFFRDGATTYIILTNNTIPPDIPAVDDAKQAAPTPAANGNVIAYAVTPPPDIAGQLIYVWDVGNSRWNGTLTHKNNTDTALTIPAAAPRTNTFSIEDASGSYQSTITLSFV